jgi:hypothetical protein
LGFFLLKLSISWVMLSPGSSIVPLLILEPKPGFDVNAFP